MRYESIRGEISLPSLQELWQNGFGILEKGAECKLKGAHLGGLKTFQAMMLVVIEHGEQAKALGVERTGHGHGIDRPVDDKESGPGCLHNLLTVRNNDLRQRHVRGVIGDKERLAGFIMGDDGLRAGHDAA